MRLSDWFAPVGSQTTEFTISSAEVEIPTNIRRLLPETVWGTLTVVPVPVPEVVESTLTEPDDVAVAIGVAVLVGVLVGVFVASGVFVAVGVNVGVLVGPGVFVVVAVGVFVAVPAAVAVGVAVPEQPDGGEAASPLISAGLSAWS